MTEDKEQAKELAKKKRKKVKTHGYRKEVAEKICDAIAVSPGVSLAALCKKHKLDICPKTIYMWRRAYPTFALMYMQAKEMQMSIYAEDSVRIAKTARKRALYIDKEGNRRVDAASIAADKLYIDTILKVASKLAPGVYGDKIEHGGTLTVSHEQWLKSARENMSKSK